MPSPENNPRLLSLQIVENIYLSLEKAHAAKMGLQEVSLDHQYVTTAIRLLNDLSLTTTSLQGMLIQEQKKWRDSGNG